jgi:hypothetical protein
LLVALVVLTLGKLAFYGTERAIKWVAAPAPVVATQKERPPARLAAPTVSEHVKTR